MSKKRGTKWVDLIFFEAEKDYKKQKQKVEAESSSNSSSNSNANITNMEQGVFLGDSWGSQPPAGIENFHSIAGELLEWDQYGSIFSQ